MNYCLDVLKYKGIHTTIERVISILIACKIMYFTSIYLSKEI